MKVFLRNLGLRWVAQVLIVSFVLVSTAAAFATEDESDVPGELLIKTPFKFVKFSVDGKMRWENHTYINGDKTLHIFGLSRDEEHSVVVQPRMEQGYAPIALTIVPEKYKRKRVRRDSERIIVFQQVFKLKFKKVVVAKDKAKSSKGAGDKVPAKKKRRHSKKTKK